MKNQNHFLPDVEEFGKLIEEAGLSKPSEPWIQPAEEVVRFGPADQAADQSEQASAEQPATQALADQPKGPVTQRLDAILDSAEEAESVAETDSESTASGSVPDELDPNARPGMVTMRLDAFLAAAAVGPKPPEVPPPARADDQDEEQVAEPTDAQITDQATDHPANQVADTTAEPLADPEDQALDGEPAEDVMVPETDAAEQAQPENTFTTDEWAELTTTDPLDVSPDTDPLPSDSEENTLSTAAALDDFDPDSLPKETQPLFEFLLKDCLHVSEASSGFLSDTDGLILAKLGVPDSLVGLSAILRNSWHQIESYLHKPSVPSVAIPIGGSETLHLLWFSTTLGTMIAGLIASNPLRPVQIIDLRTRCLKTILGFLERTNEH